MSAKDAAKIPKRIEAIKFTLMDPNEIRKDVICGSQDSGYVQRRWSPFQTRD